MGLMNTEQEPLEDGGEYGCTVIGHQVADDQLHIYAVVRTGEGVETDSLFAKRILFSLTHLADLAKKANELTDPEAALLMHFEECAVSHSGLVDSDRLWSVAAQLAIDQWVQSGFIKFGQVNPAHVTERRCNWVRLSAEAAHLAHLLRMCRAEHQWATRRYKLFEE